MTADQALALVQAAIAQARTMQVRVSAVVVDAGGHAKALWRMDGAPFHGITLATDKARTAAGFGFATALWNERIGERAHLAAGLNGRDGFIAIGGGVPVIRDGQVVGAIGISGAKEHEDCQIAEAALTAL